jgi:hypothetical protein
MTRTQVIRTIDAPLDAVFDTVAGIENLPTVIPDVIGIEFLSDSKAGVGTRFRETRTMNGKESVTELEVTECVQGERIRMVADSHGTIWDSVFTVRGAGARTELVLTMDARAKKLFASLLNPALKGLIKKGLEKHMDAVKEYCERASSAR